MKLLFIGYPKCSTSQKAKKWLEANGIDFVERHIVEENPKRHELQEWYDRSALPLKRFFNTSGLKYKELRLKDRLGEMTEEEQLDLLATDGMIVKRPILVGEDFILIGFKEPEWQKALME